MITADAAAAAAAIITNSTATALQDITHKALCKDSHTIWVKGTSNTNTVTTTITTVSTTTTPTPITTTVTTNAVLLLSYWCFVV